MLFAIGAAAQDTPKADLFLGYSFLRANSARNIPAFTANGGLGTLGFNINDHVGLEFEFGGYHNGNIHDVQFDTTMMTYLFGPRFALTGRSKRVSPYIHTLFGGIHLTTSLPVAVAVNPLSPSTSGRIAASQDNFAMALGGGLDVRLNHHISLRPIQLDYAMTRLEDFGQSGQPSQNRNQHNLRYATGISINFGGERPSPIVVTPPPAPPKMRTCVGGLSIPADQECPRQNIGLGITASAREVCQGATVRLSPAGTLPEGAALQWSLNGEPISQASTFEFGSTGRDPGPYRVGLRVTADGYNDASSETSITVNGYTPPTGTLTATPSEIWLGEKATLSANFSPGQCGGSLGPITLSASEGTISENQFDSAAVRFGPPDTSEQRRTLVLTARVTDERGAGTAQANIVVKQKALLSARQLPDVLFAQNSDRVNNCGKRVLLEQLRTLAESDPTGKVVLVGHISEAEGTSSGLDARRALNAAAVISAGRGVCTAFPASQIYLNSAGTADNGVPLQPNFCSASAATERPGQTVNPNDDNAKYRRTEVWFVPTGGAMPSSAADAKDAATMGVTRLGCPR